MNFGLFVYKLLNGIPLQDPPELIEARNYKPKIYCSWPRATYIDNSIIILPEEPCKKSIEHMDSLELEQEVNKILEELGIKHD